MKIIRGRWLAAGLALAGMVAAARGQSPAPAAQSATNTPVVAIPQSVFLVPTNTESQVRNPFFPDASIQLAPAPGQNTPPQQRTIDLTLQGFSGEGDNRLAIINDVNFSEGEQLTVNTTAGRVLVHCIKLKENSVIVQVAGEQRELRFHSDQ